MSSAQALNLQPVAGDRETMLATYATIAAGA